MTIIRTHWLVAALLIGSAASVRLGAQCADMAPAPAMPVADPTCKDNLLARAGVTRSCEDKLADQVAAWEDRYRNFGAMISSSFGIKDSYTATRLHNVRGCQGETVALTLDGGTLSQFSYQLRAPSGRVVIEGSLRPAVGRIETGPYVTLPETGTYTLLTTLRSSRYSRDSEQNTIYNYIYQLGFAGGGLEPIPLGTTINGTMDVEGIYARRVEVPAGRKLRISVSVQGDVPARLVISEADGTPLIESDLAGRRVVETLQAAAGERTYLIKVEGRTAGTGRGVEIRTDEIEDIAAELTLDQLVIDSFPGLPTTFDSRTPRDAERMEEFLRSYIFRVSGSGQVYLTVWVAEAAALRVQLRMFGEQSQQMSIRDTVIARTTTIPVPLEFDEPFIVEVRPVFARMGPRSRPVFRFQFSADDPRRARQR